MVLIGVEALDENEVKAMYAAIKEDRANNKKDGRHPKYCMLPSQSLAGPKLPRFAGPIDDRPSMIIGGLRRRVA